MKLYYSPGACSLAPHMALREAGLAFDLEQVDLGTKKTATGADFTAINPKGYVPCLQLDNGAILTECAVLLQWIADQKPALGLIPAAGTLERYQVLEVLNFIATELHKGFGPLFNPEFPDAARTIAIDNLRRRLDLLDRELAGRQFLRGDHFTVADCYLATILGWARFVKLDLAPWANLTGYLERVRARPAIQETLKAERLRV